jgi:hypothetical protein
MQLILYLSPLTPSRLLQIRSRLLNAPGLPCKIRLASAVLARIAAAQRAGARDLLGGGAACGRSTLLEGREELDGGLGGEVLVVVVVDLDHGGVDAGAEALDLDEGEEAIGGGLALLDAEVGLDGLDNGVRAAAA